MDGGLSEEAFAIEPGRVCFNLVLPSGTVWYSLIQQFSFTCWDICMLSHYCSNVLLHSFFKGRWQHCSVQFREDAFILIGGAFTEAIVTEYSGR